MCRKFMPVSSVVIGVDLVPIKAIPNVITLTKDITSDSCRSALKKELKTWKADLVLNDGAPNVGKSWIHDAFIQNRLTLSALELASHFLSKNGTFVTKVFRSKDYNALLWVMSKLFKKVSATKPQASRNESAEIFVVCQHFLSPDKIDPKFFDASFLFQDIETDENEERRRKNLLLPANKQKRSKPEGYKDGHVTQFSRIEASEFILQQNHIERLAEVNEIVFSSEEIKNYSLTSEENRNHSLTSEEIRNHPLTTDEIVECCRDIKVLGRKEILALIKWRKKLREEMLGKEKPEKTDEPMAEEIEENEEEMEEFEAEKRLKKKRKKMLNEKRKLLEKINLKMIIKNDQLVEEGDEEIFNLKKLKSKFVVKNFEEFTMSDEEKDEEKDDDDDEPIPKYVPYDKDQPIEDVDDEGMEEEDPDLAGGDDTDSLLPDSDDGENEDDDEDDEDEEKNELLDDLGTGLSRDEKKEMFFKKSVFEEFMDEEEDERILEEDEVDQKEGQKMSAVVESGIGEEEEDSESSSDEEAEKLSRKEKKKYAKCGEEIRLDATGLAVGEKMVQSGRVKREMVDEGWNRHTRGDENPPSWFRDDENKFNKRPSLLDHAVVAKYKNQMKELNVRPAKRVAEAKARKKKRTLRRMEKMKKRAESIHDAPDMSEKEKSVNLRT